MANPDESAASGLRVLVWVRGGRNVELTSSMLGEHGFQVQVCEDVAALCAGAETGAGAALLAEDLLVPDAVAQIGACWRCAGVVRLSHHRLAGRLGARHARTHPRCARNVTFLDGAVARALLVAAVHRPGSRRDSTRGAQPRVPRQLLAMLFTSCATRSAHLVAGKHSAPARALEGADISPLRRALTRWCTKARRGRVTHGKVFLTRPVNWCMCCRPREALEGRAGAHELRLTLSPSVPEVWVDGDRQRLEQVFGNLISNALKYTPSGGAVRVSVEMEPDRAVVEVADTGIGLASEEIERIFDAFAQVERSLARAQGGIGLGLRWYERHRPARRLTCAPHAGPGQGSAFGSSSRTSGRPLTPPPPPPPPPSPHRRIVVVDDNADLRELLSELLRDGGHQVDCAEDGPGGLASILGGAPDVAFVDIGLPGFDGLELARRARAGGSRTTLIAISGYGQVADKARAREAGSTIT